MSWTDTFKVDFKEDDVVADYTKILSKLWDNIMPSSYPYILEFKTKSAKEVHQKRKIGPYRRTDNFFYCDVLVIMDSKPLHDNGWDGKSEVDEKMVDKCYGDNYFHGMRTEMKDLMKYVGLEVSVFDFRAAIDAEVKDV
jgi:hypothetical protein